MKSFISVVLSLAVAFALAATAGAVPIGVPAPPLQITNWIKGAPVDLAAVRSNKVVVVEFWATWCPPCRQSIPHLTELQKKYKDQVVVVGITDEDPAVVKKFVAKMGDQMDYTVAVDGDQKTTGSYSADFGPQFAIPYAVVVDRNGVVAWSGSPFEGLDDGLDAVVKGTYDIEKMKQLAAARQDAGAKLKEFVDLASQNDNDPKLDQLGKDLVALDKELGGLRPGQTFDPLDARKMIRFQKATDEYQSAVMDGRDQPTIDQIWNEVRTNAPPDADLPDFKESVATRKSFVDYHHAVISGADPAALASLAKKLEETKSTDAELLGTIARTILLDDEIKSPDVALAMKVAKAGVDASNAKDPNALDAYALSLFASGKPRDAVTWEQKAVDAAPSDDDRQQLQKNLQKYVDAAGK